MVKKHQQNYEEYWKLTLEYSDIHGAKFRGTLALIVDFINKKKGVYSKENYQELQNIVYKKYPKANMASIRKSINQFVKLGFINFQLKSYHEDCVNFLNAPTKKRRRNLFSKILYTNSSFNRSVKTDSKKQEINFLLKTLEHIGKLHKNEIIALMTIDIEKIKKNYLTKKEIDEITKLAKENKFIERKYNQVGYLWNILNRLEDLHIQNNYLCFKEDAKEIFADDFEEKRRIRDGYLHRLYKLQLKNESEEYEGDVRCMVEHLDYPSLVASHIKPFIKSDDIEAYDPENGLLLSRNMDMLFDQGYISFKNNGEIIISKHLSKDLRQFLENYALKEVYITAKRKKYLAYHRKLFKRKLGI